MTLTAFEASLTKSDPPPHLHPLVEALWHERRGDWTRAHEIAQGIDADDAACAGASSYFLITPLPATRQTPAFFVMTQRDAAVALAESLLTN